MVTWIPALATGITAGCVPAIAINFWRIRGYRKARQDDHRRALAALDPSPHAANIAAISATFGTPASPEPMSEPEPEIPDLTEPIIGVRAWAVAPAGYLASFGQSYTWATRERSVARCNRSHGIDVYGGHSLSVAPQHSAPASGCTCGLYAAKREAEIQYSTLSGPFAWGRVALWGRVEESERGYRAQYGYPISLTLVNAERAFTGTYDSAKGPPPNTPCVTDEELETIRRHLAARYGVPVRIGTIDELTDAMLAHYHDMDIPAEVRELVG